MPDPITTEPPEEWGIVEMFGHICEAGRIAEVERYGGTMLQLDVLGGDGEISATQLIGSGAIFRITPCDQAAAKQAANRLHPPMYRFQPPAIEAEEFDDEPDDEDQPDLEGRF